jgi:hypothetical protein
MKSLKEISSMELIKALIAEELKSVSLIEAIIASIAGGLAAIAMGYNLWASCLTAFVIWFAIRSIHRRIDEMNQKEN